MLTWSLGGRVAWVRSHSPGWRSPRGVRVGRGARAGLEHVNRELIVELSRRDPIGGGGDPLGELGVEQGQLAVDRAPPRS